MKKYFLPCCFTLLLSTLQAQKTIGSIETLDAALSKVIPAEAKIEVLAEGFQWAEGPVWVPELEAVLFTDVPKNVAYKWDETHGLTPYLDPSGYTAIAPNEKKSGGNGLLLDSAGGLLIAQHGDRRIARIAPPLKTPAAFETVVGKYQGKFFNSPNDLVLSKAGDLYFTDPPYGLKGDDDPLKEIDENGVYRLSKNGDLTMLYGSLSRPNGLAFSPDESVLYVANSDPKQNLWMAFAMEEGKIIREKVFFDASGYKRRGLADGLKVHSSGYVFATGPGGVLIFSPEGKHLGTILTEVRTANCSFDAQEEYLYMTSTQYLLRIKIKEQ